MSSTGDPVADRRVVAGPRETNEDDKLPASSLDGRAALLGRRRDSGQATPGGAGDDAADGPEPRVIGYVTVDSGTARASEDATIAIQRACEDYGWSLLEVVTDRDSGRRSLERPGIGYSLDRIAAGDAQGLVVSELARLVRSVVDLAALLQWFRKRNAALVALDLGIDTSTADGRRMADILMTLGKWDQDRIARGTKTGLADAKANGRRVGRPSINDRPELRERIVEMRARGATLQAIADRLNDDGVPTVRGGAKWRPSSVQAAAGYQRPRRRTHPGARAALNDQPNLGET